MNIGKKIGESIGQSTGRVISNSAYVINDVSSVHNMREDIYQWKAEIVKSDVVKDIFKILFTDPTHPPREVVISANSVNARLYESIKNTYQIYSMPVYQPEHPFDYPTACALCLLIQDMYKDVYNFPSVTMPQLQASLSAGTWQTTLQMNTPHIGKSLTSAYTVDDLEYKPIESLPIEFKAPKRNGVKNLPVFALIVSILSLILSSTFFGIFFAVAGIIMGAIGTKTKNKRTLSVIAIVLSIIAIVLPIITAIAGFLSIL